MKTLTLTAALAALLAAPAFANDQLARSLGVEPGIYTTAELAEMQNKSSLRGNEAKVVFGGDLVSRGTGSDLTREITARFAAESDDGAERNGVFGINSDPDGTVNALAFDRLESLD
ncbi:MAG: hypothetical protein AAGF74_15790 [Pseudomonadota bacterium]